MEKRSILVKDNTMFFKSQSEIRDSLIFTSALPYFHHFTTQEQQEIYRIFNNVDQRIFNHVTYNIDYSKNFNSYTYVVDNAKHILQLPDGENSESITSKFLMLSSLASLKYFDETNIRLFFSMREEYNFGKESFYFAEDNGFLSLEKVFFPLDSRLPYLYEAFDERKHDFRMLFLLHFTFLQWCSQPSLTLREILLIQSSFGPDRSPYFLNYNMYSINEIVVYNTLLEFAKHIFTSTMPASKIWTFKNYPQNMSFFDGVLDVSLFDFEAYVVLNIPHKKIKRLNNSSKVVCDVSVKEHFSKHPYYMKNIDFSSYRELCIKESIYDNVMNRFLYALFDNHNTFCDFIHYVKLHNMEYKEMFVFAQLFKENNDSVPLELLHDLCA